MRDVYLKLVFFEKNCFQNLKYKLSRLTINKIEQLSILISKLKLGVNVDSVHSTYNHYNCTRFYRVDIIPEINLGVITFQKYHMIIMKLNTLLFFRYHHLRIRNSDIKK